MLKRIISFNTELISQLNLNMEIMCQMAQSTCSVERLQFYSYKKNKISVFLHVVCSAGRKFHTLASDNAIFDKKNDNSF